MAFENDRVEVRVVLDGMVVGVQRCIETQMNKREADINKMVEQHFRELDFEAILRIEIDREIRKTVHDLVQRAFKIEWRFEEELQNSIRGIMQARIEKAKTDAD